MNTVRLGNISIAEFKAFLESKGCVRVDNGNEGHEKWEKPGIPRPIIFQTHIDPIPEFIIRNNLRNLEITRKEFADWYIGKKTKAKKS
jgi:hypothetical protein